MAEITTDDLIELAGFCGKTCDIDTVPGVILVPRARPADAEPLEPGQYPPEEVWNPRKDANQRDELVEALYEAGYVVELSTHEDQAFDLVFVADVWPRNDPVSRPVTGDTPGDAVCLAALQAIRKGKADAKE